MTTTSTVRTDALTIVSGAPEGIVRLFVPNGLEVGKADLRRAATKAAHTIDVGRTPAGKAATLGGVKGHVFDFAPVARGARKADDVAPAADDGKAASLAALLGIDEGQAAAILASVSGGQAAPAAPSKAKGKTGETFEPVARRKAAKCVACSDIGVIRNAGKRAAEPWDGGARAYRTAGGAAESHAKGHTAVCPAPGCKAAKAVKRTGKVTVKAE